MKFFFCVTEMSLKSPFYLYVNFHINSSCSVSHYFFSNVKFRYKFYFKNTRDTLIQRLHNRLLLKTSRKCNIDRLQSLTYFLRLTEQPEAQHNRAISLDYIQNISVVDTHNLDYFWNEKTLSWLRSLSYRNQSIDLQSKPMDWFLHDRDLRHERVKIR